MANKTISELTNAALPLAGTDKTIVSRDGVTLNDVLLSDLKSYIGTSGFVSTAFSTTLSFDGVNKEMPITSITENWSFSSTGTSSGTQIILPIRANGTNAPIFAGNFSELEGSNGYVSTANVINIYNFFYLAGQPMYQVTQRIGDTGVAETLPVNTVAPVLSAVTVGGALSCTNGTWTGNPTPTFTKQFKLDGVNIASNYTVVSGDVGKVVTCVVTATNTVGAVNATSNSQTVAASATVPAQVTGLTLGTPTSTTQPLTWTAPSNGGSAITDYLVEYKAASSGTWLTFSDGTSTATSANVTGLTASTSYNYRVSAINAVGTGAASATGTGSTTSGSSFMYDGTAAIWSMRKVPQTTPYSGSAIRIRRSSDNTEQDIGFSGSNLDTAAISTFVGANSAFVVTWYDQSGNGRNATIATAGKQPRIVNAGTLDVEGAIAAMQFDGTDDIFAVTSGLTGFTNNVGYIHTFVVSKNSETGTTPRQLLYISTNNTSSITRHAINNSGANAASWAVGWRRLDADGSSVAINATSSHSNTQKQISSLVSYAAGNAALYQDGVSVGTGTPSTGNTSATNPAYVSIGGYYGSTGVGSSTQHFIGSMQEMIIYTTDQTANRAAIESDQMGYY